MSIQPARKPGRDFEWVKAIVKQYEEKLEGCAFVGVMCRGYFLDSMGAVGKNDRGIYDDAFFWINTKTGAFVSYNGNSDPSIFRTRVATIQSGQVCWYKQGKHGLSGPKPYPAFRQSRPITVIRDGISKPDRGMYYTNLHRGGVRGTSSLGCLTVPPSQWDSCKAFGYDQMNRAGQKEVPVIVVEAQG